MFLSIILEYPPFMDKNRLKPPEGALQVQFKFGRVAFAPGSENQRGQPLPNAKGEQSKFIENSMFHDTNIIICQSQVVIWH